MKAAGSSRNGTKDKDVKAPARPSSSVIVVSPKLEVLLLHRVQTSSSFPSAHVFPGGNIEQQDGHIPECGLQRHQDNPAYRSGALRELFEESGILLARKQRGSQEMVSISQVARKEGRRLVHSNKLDFQTWLMEKAPGAVLDTGRLIPFSRWITPPNLPRRYTTQMYLYILPPQNSESLPQSAQSMRPIISQHPSRPPFEPSDDSQDFTPTSDSGLENTTASFAPAHVWLRRAHSGEIILFPPQYLLLHLASEILDGPGNATSNEPDRISNSQRLEKLQRFIDSRSAGGSPPWNEKCISPYVMAMSRPREDGKLVLGLDRPGFEVEGTGLRGDGERVVLVKWIAGVPRELEIRWRKHAVEEARSDILPKL